MAVLGTCKLCGRAGELRESHIIPHFVFDWLKRTSSTGFLRAGNQINRRRQDGLKTPFLCADCESRLNAWETPFATQIFLPYHEQDQTVFGYQSWLLRFCVSVSWRVLAYRMQQGSIRELEADHCEALNGALTTWSAFLLGQRNDVGAFEQHLLPIGAIASVDMELPANVQRYLMRAVEQQCFWTPHSALTFAKMGRLLVIGFIHEPEASRWRETKVCEVSGTIAPSTIRIPDWLRRELLVRGPERLAETQRTLSARQRNAIERLQQANPERVLTSETVTALIEDLRLRRPNGK